MAARNNNEVNRLNETVSRKPERLQMADPREVIRQRLAERFARQIAEMALKVDKPSHDMTLADLRCDRAAAIYVEKALEFLLGPSRQTRISDVLAAQAHQRALEEKSAEDVAAAARQDVIAYGSGRTH